MQSNENGIKAVVSEDAATAFNGNRFNCFAGGLPIKSTHDEARFNYTFRTVPWPDGHGIARSQEKIDAAVVLLAPETVDSLIAFKYSFMDVNHMGINHNQRSQIPFYVAKGFPVSKTKWDCSDGKFHEHSFTYVSSLVGKIQYPKYDCDPICNICLSKNRKAIVNLKKQIKGLMPQPHGISGGGLYYTDINKNDYQLVGILIEYNQYVFIATKIDIFTEIIRQKFNDILVPPSRITINFI